MRKVCELAAQSLRESGLAGNESAFIAYTELNEMWVALYGHEILRDEPIRPKKK